MDSDNTIQFRKLYQHRILGHLPMRLQLFPLHQLLIVQILTPAEMGMRLHDYNLIRHGVGPQLSSLRPMIIPIVRGKEGLENDDNYPWGKGSAGTIPVQPSLSITVEMTNF